MTNDIKYFPLDEQKLIPFALGRLLWALPWWPAHALIERVTGRVLVRAYGPKDQHTICFWWGWKSDFLTAASKPQGQEQ